MKSQKIEGYSVVTLFLITTDYVITSVLGIEALIYARLSIVIIVVAHGSTIFI